MKTYYRFTLLIALLTITGLSSLRAQRTLTGIVYFNGEPSGLISVEAHLGEAYLTEPNGKYIIKGSEESQWLRFTYLNQSPPNYLNQSKTLDISDKDGDEFDFVFDNEEIPFDRDVTIQFTGMSPYVGKMLRLVVKDRNTGNERDNADIVVKDEFTLNVTGIIPGKSFNIDFFIDENRNGEYNAPPADPSWRIELNNLAEDTTIMFSNNTEYTDIQWNSFINNGDSTVYFIVEEMPFFPGGEVALRDFISQNLIYPDSVKKEGIQGRVYVTFVIEKDGTVINVRVARGVVPILDAEAVRLVESMPKWTPGYQDGVQVRVSYTVPVNFTLPTFTVLTEKTTDEFKIYPNPAKNIIHISSPDFDKFNYSIIDLSGRTILSGSSNKNSKEVKLQHISKGSYIILLNNTDTRFSKLISIE